MLTGDEALVFQTLEILADCRLRDMERGCKFTHTGGYLFLQPLKVAATA